MRRGGRNALIPLALQTLGLVILAALLFALALAGLVTVLTGVMMAYQSHVHMRR